MKNFFNRSTDNQIGSKKLIQAISIIFAAWIISIGIIYIKAWVGPTSAPAAGSGALAVDGSGNVGIPTTDASYKLNVTGNVNATAYYGDGSNLTGISAGKWSDGAASSIYYNTASVGIGTTNPASELEVRGEIRATDSSGANRLWGWGRPGAVRYGTSGVESGLCSNGGVNFGLSYGISNWGSAASTCPAGTWVCTNAERGSAVCDTARPDSSSDTYYCSFSLNNENSNNHPGWLADMGGGPNLFSWRREGGAAGSVQACFIVPSWCCSN